MNRTGRARLHMGCGESLYSRWQICRTASEGAASDRREDDAGRKAGRPARVRRRQRCTH